MDKHERESKMKKEINIVKKAGKELGKLIRIAHSDHAPTIMAFYEKGVVAVAIGGTQPFITKYN